MYKGTKTAVPRLVIDEARNKKNCINLFLDYSDFYNRKKDEFYRNKEKMRVTVLQRCFQMSRWC